MLKEDMYAGIMKTGVFMEYKGRSIGLNTLNEKLRSYGVQIVSKKNYIRNENYQRTFWILIEI